MPKLLVTKESLECWDDDEDFADVDNIGPKSHGVTNIQFPETSSSRASMSSGGQSNFDSDDGYDQQFLLPPDAESSEQAIRAAVAAGIPIPKNVPPSALLGGSIKKLGPRRRRSPIPGDWGDEIELPTALPMKLKNLQITRFPSSLSDKSSGNSNSQEAEDGDDVPTIRVSKRVTPKATLIGAFDKPASPEAKRRSHLAASHDDFEDDFDLSEGVRGLELLSRAQQEPHTPPSMSFNDSDADDWGEGSLGVRHGGTRRNRSGSLASLLSPSASSTLTFDSEDEMLHGLELPETTGFNFKKALEQKQQVLQSQAAAFQRPRQSRSKEEFLEGLEFGDGDLFNVPGSTRNRNVKHTSTQPMSPGKRTAVSLTFSQQQSPTHPSRSRRLSVNKVPKLDTLVEVQGKAQDSRRTRHDPSPTRSSRGQIENKRLPSQTLLAPDGSQPMNNRQKSLRSQKSTPNLKNPGSSPVKLRQPLPPPVPSAMRQPRPSSRTGFIPQPRPPSRSSLGPNLNRPSSRTGFSQLPQMRPASRSSLGRPQSRNRPRSPSYDRLSANSRSSNHRPPSRTSSRLSSHSRNENRSKSPRRPGTPLEHSHTPFLPAGSSLQQSHHVLSKLSRQPSEKALGKTNSNENVKKPSVSAKKSSPYRPQTAIAPDVLRSEAAGVSTMRVPMRKRNFGNGSELQNFDDLPTISRNNPNNLPHGLHRTTSKILNKAKKLPASEGQTQQASKAGLPDMTPEAHVSRVAPVPRVEQLNPLAEAQRLQDSRLPRRRPNKPQQQSQKPKLIRPGLADIPKAQDMRYNPKTYRWEGNDNEGKPFEEASGLPTNLPRPALIASIKSAQNVQVVGQMVFDPKHMCWLKVDSTASDDDDDVFASIDDLDDGTSTTPESTALSGSVHLNDVIAEEFDVGPRFIQQQKEEEERWRNKVKGWISSNEARSSSKAWELREIALDGRGPPL